MTGWDECSLYSSRSDVMWSRALVSLSVTVCFTFKLCLNPRKWLELFNVYRWLLALLCCNFCGLTRLFGINLFICTLHLTLHLPVFWQVSVAAQYYHILQGYSCHNLQHPLFVNCSITYSVQVIHDLLCIIVTGGGFSWMDHARPRVKGKLKFIIFCMHGWVCQVGGRSIIGHWIVFLKKVLEGRVEW